MRKALKVFRNYVSIVFAMVLIFVFNGSNQQNLQMKAANSSYRVGETVTFGHYEQDSSKAGAEPIEWIVLEVQNGGVYLLSKYGLDAKPYNRTDTDVTWETCSLRGWLNNQFYNSAFSNSEKQQIRLISLENLGNTQFGTPGGRDTSDYVFLLDIRDYNRVMSGRSYSRCTATKYARANGGSVWSDGYSPWWLRDPTYYQGGATTINSEGRLDYNANVGNNVIIVRPAIFIRN